MSARIRNKSGGTILDAVLASSEGQLAAAIRLGGEIDQTDAGGRTALHHACIQGRIDLVEVLLQSNADVTRADSLGMTPLHYAVGAHNDDICRRLLGLGAPVDAADLHGNTPLFRAVFESRGRGEVISLLLSSGAKPDEANRYGVTPRELATRIANYDVTKWLAG